MYVLLFAVKHEGALQTILEKNYNIIVTLGRGDELYDAFLKTDFSNDVV